MSYVPSYTSRINWENEPSTASPINETNLNKMDYALYQHDQALQGQDGRISTLEGASKVTSFKGRTGAVVPANDDYTIAQIKATGTAGQVPTLNSQGKLEMADIPESGHEIVNPSGTSMNQRSKLKFMGSVSVSDDSANDQTVVNVTGGGGGGSGHTIQNPSGSSMTQRTNLQFTGSGVTVSDNSTDDKTVVDITGGGHTIQNSAGTPLTQRNNLQFTDGLEATDDAQGAKTKVGMSLPTISLADWNAMSTAEQTAYKSAHYRFGIELPDTEGVINAEYMKLLWENPNTTQAFAGQTVTLNSADYDFIRVYFNYDTSFTLVDIAEAPKGKRVWLNAVDNATAKHTYMRTLEFSSDTVATFSGGYLDGTTNNSVCIPIAIYGIKASFQFKMNAIADTLSTRADHCFLDDEVTTVEDKFEELQANNGGARVDIKSYGSSNPYTIPSDGYIELNTSNGSGQNGTVRINGADGNLLTFVRADYPAISSVYVRKGMKVYTQSSTTNMVITFAPIV